MDTVEQMKLFMEPKSVAIIGVPRQTGEGSFNILENLVALGFAGRLYPVNPEADQILGIRAYPTVRDIPEEVDLAVIATPRHSVLGVVEECAQKGIKAMIVVAQGFADIGGEGQEMQAKMVSIATGAGARIIGPNTTGVANVFYNLNTSYALGQMDKIPVAIICQSGTFFPGPHKVLPAGKAIDLGNACDIDFSDGLEYFEDDPDIKLLVLHIEGMRNGRRFVEVARRVTRRKPVIALKGGRSESGARAALSHTGLLTGEAQVYDAAFKQAGIIQVDAFDELDDLIKAFLCLPLMRGNRLGVVSATGAGGVIISDICQRYNLEIARLSPETLAKIQGLFPRWMKAGNPVDYWPAFQSLGVPHREAVARPLELMAADQGVDAVVVVAGMIEERGSLGLAEDIFGIARTFSDKPIVCWLFGPYSGMATAYLDQTAKAAAFPNWDRALRALARLREYSGIREGATGE